MRDEELTRRFDTIEERFKTVDERFEAVDERFDAVDKRFDAIDTRFDAVHERFVTLDQRLDGFATKMDLEQMSTEIRNHFDMVTEAFKAEVRLIAEGHRALRATDIALIGAARRLEKRQDRMELRQLALETRRRTRKKDR